MTNRMTAGEAFYRSSYELDPRPISWESLSSETKRSWETGAKEVLSDAAAIRGRMGEGWQPKRFLSTDTMVEAAARSLCFANGPSECRDPKHCGSPSGCGGWAEIADQTRHALDSALATLPEPPQCQT